MGQGINEIDDSWESIILFTREVMNDHNFEGIQLPSKIKAFDNDREVLCLLLAVVGMFAQVKSTKWRSILRELESFHIEEYRILKKIEDFCGCHEPPLNSPYNDNSSSENSMSFSPQKEPSLLRVIDELQENLKECQSEKDALETEIDFLKSENIVLMETIREKEMMLSDTVQIAEELRKSKETKISIYESRIIEKSHLTTIESLRKRIRVSEEIINDLEKRNAILREDIYILSKENSAQETKHKLEVDRLLEKQTKQISRLENMEKEAFTSKLKLQSFHEQIDVLATQLKEAFGKIKLVQETSRKDKAHLFKVISNLSSSNSKLRAKSNLLKEKYQNLKEEHSRLEDSINLDSSMSFLSGRGSINLLDELEETKAEQNQVIELENQLQQERELHLSYKGRSEAEVSNLKHRLEELEAEIKRKEGIESERKITNTRIVAEDTKMETKEEADLLHSLIKQLSNENLAKFDSKRLKSNKHRREKSYLTNFFKYIGISNK